MNSMSIDGLCDPLLQFQLTYSPVEPDGNTVGEPLSGENISPDQTSIQVTNLTINTGYRVRVVAATSAGTGTPANQTGMTDEDGIAIILLSDQITELFCPPSLPTHTHSAPQAVTNLHIQSSPQTMVPNNVMINFSWTGPSTRNGPYNFSVTFSGEQVDDYPKERMGNHPETTIVIDGSNTSLSTIGLPYANYTINVTAFNIKTNRLGPSTIHQDRTISIGKAIT